MFCASFVIKTAFINHQNCCCCCTRKRWSEGRRLPARHHKCFFFSNEDYDDSDTAFCAAACAGWQQQPVLVCRLWQRLANISSYYPHCSCTAELLTVHPAWPGSLASGNLSGTLLCIQQAAPSIRWWWLWWWQSWCILFIQYKAIFLIWGPRPPFWASSQSGQFTYTTISGSFTDNSLENIFLVFRLTLFGTKEWIDQSIILLLVWTLKSFLASSGEVSVHLAAWAPWPTVQGSHRGVAWGIPVPSICWDKHLIAIFLLWWKFYCLNLI